MIKRWDTLRIALVYGAPLGVAYSVFNTPVSYWVASGETMGYAVGGLIGGAVGGAGVFAAVCGARNMILRAK